MTQDSEEGEGREGNTEPELTDARPQNIENIERSDLPTKARNTSSFGRVIKPRQQYIEQTDT